MQKLKTQTQAKDDKQDDVDVAAAQEQDKDWSIGGKGSGREQKGDFLRSMKTCLVGLGVFHSTSHTTLDAK